MRKSTAWAGVALAIGAFALMIVGLVLRSIVTMLIAAGVIVALRVAVSVVRRRAP
jgi:hypothetical protein